MDDFMYVLVAALAVLVLAFALSFIGPWVTPGNYVVQVTNFSVGKIGVVTDVPTRTDSFGSFVVGEKQSEEIRKVPQLTVGASWFGANVQKYQADIPEWFLEDLKDVKISFSVYDTNKYGAFVVVWNGLVVNQQITDKGRHEIIVKSENVKESNNIQVYCEGPGPLFWASTVYVVRDFTVNVEYGPRKLVPFQALQGELETFSKGDVSFYATDATSTLRIKVNGQEIYSQVPKGQGTVQFDFVKVPLNAGTNIISFSTDGVIELHDVALNIFLLTDEVVRVRRFNLTEEQYNLFAQDYHGKVVFDVSSVLRSGNLNVRINDRTTRVSDAATGENTVSFSKDDVHSGENEIAFSGTGGFMVGDAAITIGPGL
jgi:hypothetical protein